MYSGTCHCTRIRCLPTSSSGSVRWPPPSYAEVRLYRYNVEGHGPVRIFEQGRFSESVVGSVALNREQIRRLLAATTGAHPEHPVAMCFNPRHAFVFLDSAGKPLSFAEVCFECSNYRLSNAAPNVFDMQALGRIVKEAGMPLE